MKNKIDLFLDSGAFSAHTKGIDIKIEDYIAFIKTHKDVIKVYSNLDAIGDPEQTRKNQMMMEQEGLMPLPVFHYGEDPEKYLVPLLDKYDYIAIGGMVKSSGPNQLFLNHIFKNYICDPKGFPKVKVHGFGQTSLKLLWRYPWYSVDSTSWLMSSRMGTFNMPVWRKGKWDYHEAWSVSISSRSGDLKKNNQHYFNTNLKIKAIIDRYLQEKGFVVGKSHFEFYDPEYVIEDKEKMIWAEKKVPGMIKRRIEIIEEKGISNDYLMRDAANIQFFIDLQKEIPSYPRKFEIGIDSLF